MPIDKKSLEDSVLVALIVVGLAGCSYFYFQDGGKPLSAFFASFALSCVVYRFLGGIAQGTSFGMGFLKLGGSAAFILGCIWFLNTQVFVSRDSIILSMPQHTRWYPVRMDAGFPDTVIVLNATGSQDSFFISPRDIENLKNNEFEAVHEQGNKLWIKKANTLLGFATWTAQAKPRQIHEPDIFMLYPYGEPRQFRSARYPFTVSVEGGHFSVRRVDTGQPACDDCSEREVIRKKHIFFEVDGSQFICFVLQANHQLEPERWYSQYLIGRLVYRD